MEFRPWAYQTYCIERILQDSAVGLFLRPGLGKTSITLTAVDILRYQSWQIAKVLIIAPKKVAEATWSKEAAKWDHLKHLKCEVVLGSVVKRVRALNTPADVYIINRENIPWLVEYYQQAWPFDMVVCDESTSFKNHQSKRFKALKLIRRFCKKVVLLTGTPSSKGLIDLWAQVYLLDGGERLGKTISQYRERYFTANTHGGHFTEFKSKSGADAAVLEAISDICVSMKAEDYLELPECVEQEIPVMLEDRVKREYDKFERDLLLEIEDETITAQGAAVLTGKLLQYCNGAIYNDEKQTVPVHDCKLDAYMELLEQLDGEAVMTFYSYRHDLDRIFEKLKKTKRRVRVYSGPQDEADWNAGKIDVLLAHPASCAYGLNLQAGGRHVVWFGLNWSFELNDQGKCRLWRQGSEFDKVFIHYLVVQGGVDEDVMAAIRDRADTHEAVMGALKARIKKIKGGGHSMKNSDLVREFMTKFKEQVDVDIEQTDEYGIKEEGIKELFEYRLRLIKEELEELRTGMGEFNFSVESRRVWGGGSLGPSIDKEVREAKVEILDALADLLYVVYGTAIAFKMDIDEAMRRVHASNMTKLGLFEQPIHDVSGRIMKGPYYRKPELEDLV